MQNRPKAGLPREARLRGYDAFGSIFRSGDGLRRGELILKYIVHQPGAGAIRAGFVVRRGTGGAVRRNRVRRLLRETYRLQCTSFAASLPGGLDLSIVFLWSGTPQQAVNPRFDVIEAQMRAALDALAKRLRRRNDATGEQRYGR
ncbi:MAG TPA: ribonuclease P protein component [Candidatus Kapabacteria bacterium]|nr:ribonuclease P protein component [Candidatus Kapabacteria bacterium]